MENSNGISTLDHIIATAEEKPPHGDASLDDAAVMEEPANDSEAETEILPGSQSHTPVKPDSKARVGKNLDMKIEEGDGAFGGMAMSQDTKYTNGLARARHTRQTSSQAGIKRKAPDENSLPNAMNGHTRSTRNHAGSPGARAKKARRSLSQSPPSAARQEEGQPKSPLETAKRSEPEGEVLSHEPKRAGSGRSQSRATEMSEAGEEIETRSARSAKASSPHMTRKSQSPPTRSSRAKIAGSSSSSTTSSTASNSTRPSTKSLQSGTKPAKASHASKPSHANSLPTSRRSSAKHQSTSPIHINPEHPSILDSASNRALTQEPRTRSVSPHHQHKRSSSFQSNRMNKQEPERRLRTRHPSNQSSLPNSSLRHQSEHPHHSPTLPQYNSANSPMGPRSSNVDKNGATELARLCESVTIDDGKMKLIEDELERSPGDLEQGDFAQNRPLQKAALIGHVRVVEALIKAGAQLDVSNDPDHPKGDTPLIDAIDRGHEGVVKALLDAGANPWKKNAHFSMPSDCLKDAQEEESVELPIIQRMTQLLKESQQRHLKNDNDHCQHSYDPNKLAKVNCKHKQFRPTLNAAEMERRIEIADVEGFQEVLNLHVKPNLKCALAAAYVGNVHIYKRIYSDFTGAGLDIDPQSTDGESDTPRT